MKILKWIGIVLAAIIAIPLIVALFIEKDYGVEREIVIQKSQIEVFDYIKYLKNQNEYSKWAQMDPQMKKIYKGTDATVGFVSRWESTDNEVGVGEQEIIKITEGQRIDYEIRFFVPFESTEKAYLTTEAVTDNQTKVKWGFNGHIDYPMNLMSVLFNFEATIGNDLETGLKNLKTKLEKE